MILVVSLNPALDLTYEVDAADWAGVNRPHTVHVRPGGKGVNVARTLVALGHQVRLAGFVGGSAGAELAALLAESGIELAFTSIAGATRRTLTVVDGFRDQAALFNEPGPFVEVAEYAEFMAGYRVALDGCDAVVLSGSLPGGVGTHAYAELIAFARAASVPAILDTSGPALALGAAAGPTLVKPNLAELEDLTGRSLSVGGASTPNRAGEDGGSVGTRLAAPASFSASAPGPASASPSARAPRPPSSSPAPSAATPSARAPRPPSSSPAPCAATPSARAPRPPSSSSSSSPAPSAAIPSARAQASPSPSADGVGSAASRGPGCRDGDIGGTSLSSVEEAARELLQLGARSVVVSCGEDGLLAVIGDGRLLARPGEPVSGNPTGAGDAALAGLVDGFVRALTWPELLRHAVALGAATVAAPVAGEFVFAEYERQHRNAELGISGNSSSSEVRNPRVTPDLSETNESSSPRSRMNMQIHPDSGG